MLLGVDERICCLTNRLMGIEGDVVSCLYEIVSKIRSQVFRKITNPRSYFINLCLGKEKDSEAIFEPQERIKLWSRS